jgi:hypothetical protein
MIAPRESAELAHELIAATCDKEGIVRGQLTLHADRGTSMRFANNARASAMPKNNEGRVAPRRSECTRLYMLKGFPIRRVGATRRDVAIEWCTGELRREAAIGR